MRKAASNKKQNVYNKNDLVEGLQTVGKKLSPYDSEILKSIFQPNLAEFKDIFNNMINNNQSDVLISYGNNNYASKILFESIIKDYEALNTDEYGEIDVPVKKIYFNSFIHASEDMILKKICKELEIDADKASYVGHRSAIEEYYNKFSDKKSKKKKDVKEIKQKHVVIFFDNVDYLFQKKKQVLFYTLLEIVSISHNIIFVGLTSNFNLLDLMEKRIRSRFSQKTSFLRVNDFQNIIAILEGIFKKESTPNNDLLHFYNEFILNDEDESPDVDNALFNYNMIIIIQKYVNLGLSIKEILTKIQYIISNVVLEIKETYPDDDAIIQKDEIKSIITDALTDYVDEELDGCYYNVLKNFPKLHISLLVSLYKCIQNFGEKITIGMIYKEYKSYCEPISNYGGSIKKNTLDQLQIKQALEELFSSNMINIKSDEKYIQIYELKLPKDLLNKLFVKLELNKSPNFDWELKQFLNANK